METQKKGFTEKDRLIQALFSDKGQELQNIKFFMGDNRNTTEEELCREANHALAQVRLGAVSPKRSVDGNIKKTKIGDFLKCHLPA